MYPGIPSRLHGLINISLLGLCCLLAAPTAAFAGAPVVYSPSVIKGQTEFEFRSSDARNSGTDDTQNYAFAIGHAFTSWWRPELYIGRYERGSDGVMRFGGYEIENIFQLAPTGRYWADIGLLASYEINPATIESDKLEFGPLFEKRTGRVLQRLNLLWEKGVGPGSDGIYEFHGAYSFRYQYRKTLAPGFEIYALPVNDAYRAGPVLYGEKVFAKAGSELEYSAGVLFGVSRSAPDLTVVFRLEYELF